MDVNKEILKGYIDTILLTLLAKRDMYGYELAKEIREKSNGLFEMKEGTMYLALKRLEANTLVESYWGEEESEGGRRKYYKIMPLAIQRLGEKRNEWKFVRQVMDLFFEEG
ncbi:MAG: PadR family transcriptional regulator [Bacillota bacterium]|nr:PadR family transcriptional regulator [Bacillota bacterium]